MTSIYRTKRDWLHGLYSLWGTLRYRRVYKKLRIIAVTGTDGKSSTVILLARLLQNSGYRVAHYSSVSYSYGNEELPNTLKMTTPGHGKLHHFLGTAARQGCAFAIIEVTSEGIKQWRHAGISLEGVAITNIYPEHIERHKTFAHYLATKLSLVKSVTKGGFVCASKELIKLIAPSPSSIRLISVTETTKTTSDGNPFIMQNLYLATAVVEALGLPVVPLESVECTIAGRFEILSESPRVIVDYAHTVPALDRCLQAVRQTNAKGGTIIHVFGAAGGGRDKSKRPKLARVSEQYTDIHILTEENPFDESVDDIIRDIQSGFTLSHATYIKPVREDAIRLALQLAGPNDTVVCTAKGSETVIAGPAATLRPYNERDFITQCLRLSKQL